MRGREGKAGRHMKQACGTARLGTNTPQLHLGARGEQHAPHVWVLLELCEIALCSKRPTCKGSQTCEGRPTCKERQIFTGDECRRH